MDFPFKINSTQLDKLRIFTYGIKLTYNEIIESVAGNFLSRLKHEKINLNSYMVPRNYKATNHDAYEEYIRCDKKLTLDISSPVMAEFKSIGREKYGLALSEFLHRVILYTLNEEKLLNVAGLLNWEDKKRAKKA